MTQSQLLITQLKGAERNLDQNLKISTRLAKENNTENRILDAVHCDFYGGYFSEVKKIISEYEQCYSK